MILNEFFNLPQVFEKDMTEGSGNIGAQIKAVYQKIYDQGDDAIEFAYNDSPIFAQYWDEYEGDLDSIIAEVEPSELQIILDELQSAAEDQGVAEGIFGSRPSPVLPIVDKIAKVAGGLTPQNVETGKQIIQANARDITRILSPQSKAGVDVIEAAKWRDPKYKDQLYTQEPPDYNDTREYDRAMFDPKPDDYPGRKELPGGGEYDRTDPLVRGAGIGRSGIKNNILDRGKRKGLPSRDQITSLKQSIKDISGRHTRANLPEQGVAEAKDDYVPPKEADYGPEYQAMVRRVGQKAKQQEKAKQQQPKAPVRESRLALLKQIIQS